MAKPRAIHFLASMLLEGRVLTTSNIPKEGVLGDSGSERRAWSIVVCGSLYWEASHRGRICNSVSHEQLTLRYAIQLPV